jgi:hypothetical protein
LSGKTFSAGVVKALPEKCNKFVTTDSQARALSKVEPKKRVEVLKKAAKPGRSTTISKLLLRGFIGLFR